VLKSCLNRSNQAIKLTGTHSISTKMSSFLLFITHKNSSIDYQLLNLIIAKAYPTFIDNSFFKMIYVMLSSLKNTFLCFVTNAWLVSAK